jgi:hypothetical protein
MANQPVKTDLTRTEMEAVIASGGSVMHGGQIHTSAETLPDAIDLATTDEDAEAAEAAIAEEEKTLAAKKEKVAAKKSAAKKK